MSAPVVAEAEAQQSSATTTTIKSIKDDPYANKTVIAVNQSVVVDDPGVSYGPSGGVGTSGAANTSLGVPSSKQPVGRSLSNRSSVFAKGSLQGGGGGKKLGHRRVGDDGEITYKKFETTQLIGSIQIGLQYAVGSEVNIPDRDLLMQDFMSIDTASFSRDGLLQKTPAHNFTEFRFRTYAAHAFRVFRRLFEIETDLFLASLVSEPMVELSNAGASGSIFYVSRDDNFILKTVQHKEAEFLQKLLPGYYMNLKQNPRTLLPKFFGLYCYSCNAKNVRILVMNNLLPSGLKMHQKFDLKGSTYKRKASKRERDKDCPTFKDLDFLEMYPEGIFMQPEIYTSLMTSIQRDCRVLESFKIMDYSLLIGIHNVDSANKEKGEADGGPLPNETTVSSNQLAVSDNDSTSTGGGYYGHFERQGSFQTRERMIAHSTALESITMEVDSVSNAPMVEKESVLLPTTSEKGFGVGGGGLGADRDSDETDSGINNVWGGIPAKNRRGENLLLFIGIIDILQSYGMLKKVEHYWKSLVHDGDTVSVHRPGFYSKRFQAFLNDKVFKKATPAAACAQGPPSNAPSDQTNKKGTSLKRNQFRRTWSKDQTSVSTNVASPSQETKRKESTVTVIKIGDDSDIHLPSVLQDRKRMPSASGSTGQQGQQQQTPAGQSHAQDRPQGAASPTSSVVIVNADVSSRQVNIDGGSDADRHHTQTPTSTSSPLSSRIALAGVNDDLHETGSVITMTSDERVQIFVPSPQGTPYNTITKSASDMTSSIGASNLLPLFAPQRLPASESYRSLTPLNMPTSVTASPLHESTTQTMQVTTTEMTSLEMVKISLVSTESTTSTEVNTQTTDRTLANDLESLPIDEAAEPEDPVSLSHIKLEEVAEDGEDSSDKRKEALT